MTRRRKSSPYAGVASPSFLSPRTPPSARPSSSSSPALLTPLQPSPDGGVVLDCSSLSPMGASPLGSNRLGVACLCKSTLQQSPFLGGQWIQLSLAGDTDPFCCALVVQSKEVAAAEVVLDLESFSNLCLRGAAFSSDVRVCLDSLRDAPAPLQAGSSLRLRFHHCDPAWELTLGLEVFPHELDREEHHAKVRRRLHAVEAIMGSALEYKMVCPGQLVACTFHRQDFFFTVEYDGASADGPLEMIREDGSPLRVDEFLWPEGAQASDGHPAGGVAAMDPRLLPPLGGLSGQLELVRHMMSLCLEGAPFLEDAGLKPPRGVLLVGPPGTGKTLLARHLCAASGAHLCCLGGSDLTSKFVGEAEQKLKAIFDEACAKAPSIVFVDEVDALCPNREEVRDESTRRVVGLFLSLLDGLHASKGVFVVGATNRVASMDPAFRRPGRFDKEVLFDVPSEEERADILDSLLQGIPHQIYPEECSELASQMHGFVGADVAALVREASLHAIRRLTQHLSLDQLLAQDAALADTGALQLEDFAHAMHHVRPSAMREVAVEVPHVRWEDIGGAAPIREKLTEMVEWPLKHKASFQRMGIRPPKGILFYGPPGCSKTLMAKAMATESGLNFLLVKGPELFSKWVGESERAVRETFRKARAVAPSIIFFDEIDAIATRRGSSGTGVGDRVLSQLLHEMDGVETDDSVVVVAATNRPDILDDAIMRPGRFDRSLYVGLPDREGRLEILRIHLREVPVDEDVDLPTLASSALEGYSGAEIAALCREACLLAIQEDPEGAAVLRKRHLDQALETVTPRTSGELLRHYDRFRKQKAGK